MATNESAADQKPWEEYQDLMNTRTVIIMISTVIMPLSVYQPFLLGPVTIYLLMRPMQLAIQSINIMEEGVYADEYLIPDWFNSCVEESTQINQEEANLQHDTSNAIQ